MNLYKGLKIMFNLNKLSLFISFLFLSSCAWKDGQIETLNFDNVDKNNNVKLITELSDKDEQSENNKNVSDIDIYGLIQIEEGDTIKYSNFENKWSFSTFKEAINDETGDNQYFTKITYTGSGGWSNYIDVKNFVSYFHNIDKSFMADITSHVEFIYKNKLVTFDNGFKVWDMKNSNRSNNQLLKELFPELNIIKLSSRNKDGIITSKMGLFILENDNNEDLYKYDLDIKPIKKGLPIYKVEEPKRVVYHRYTGQKTEDGAIYIDFK